jgi:pimeloyl-ACP methyl ester carboxylesterase
VILIDLLGFGTAAKPRDIDYSYDDQVEHINKIVSNLQFKNMTIIGHSMGALVAARYAALFPAKVISLVLLHPPMYTSAKEAKETLLRTGMIYRHLLKSRFRNITWVFVRVIAPSFIARHTHYARERSLQNVIVKAELFADIEALKMKTLILVGRKDRPVYRRNLVNISQPLVKILLENVGHHSPIWRPMFVQSLILNFIKP